LGANENPTVFEPRRLMTRSVFAGAGIESLVVVGVAGGSLGAVGPGCWLADPHAASAITRGSVFIRPASDALVAFSPR